MGRTVWLMGLLAIFVVATRGDEIEQAARALPPPKSPAEGLASLHVDESLIVELVAAEPLIADPVAFDWGPDGSLWVAEMADYPNGADWRRSGDPLGTPGGRVRRLFDDDGDGQFDRSQLFLENLPFPNGVKVWRDGVLVTAAPHVLFAADRDGDGRADERRVLFSGFVEGNQQHRINGLRWGLDNWLYLANGDSGGQVRSEQTGAEVNIRGRDLRIRPDSGELQTIAGQTQFGRDTDDWGNWFGGNNSNPAWHYVLDDDRLRRNPHVAVASSRHDVPVEPGAAPVFPASRTIARFNDFDKADRFTSACSPALYRDRLLGPSFENSLFVCEPVHNLVSRQVLSRVGATFRGERTASEQRREFLASDDNWFRPTMVRTGPDGAVWVADMYRLVIEHPEWIPQAWQRHLDLRAGHDRGRIYRVRLRQTPPRRFEPLDRLDTAELVAQLDSDSGWRRDLVQQMILWNGKAKAAPLLGELLHSHSRAQTRLHALATLDGLNTLTDDQLVRALRDDHPGVRQHALRLAGGRIDGSPAIAAAVARLSDDADLAVQLHLAYALGEWQDPRAGELLARQMAATPDDPWLRAAVVSSVGPAQLPAMAAGAAAAGAAAGEPRAAWAEPLLATAAGYGDWASFAVIADRCLTMTIPRPTSAELALAGLVLNATLRREDVARKELTPVVVAKLDAFVQAATAIALNPREPAADRLAALRLVERQLAREPQLAQSIRRLVHPQEDPAVQIAVIDVLAAAGQRDVSQWLLAGWDEYSPALRAKVLDALIRRVPWANDLLTVLEQAAGARTTELHAAQRQALLEHPDLQVRTRAASILAGQHAPARADLVAAWADVLKMSGDEGQGRAAFEKRCAACHQVDGLGQAIGPNLAALGDRSPPSLLTAILDPNRAVEDRFRSYSIVTDDGRQLIGMIVQEAGASLTLAGSDGKSFAVLRSQIESLRATGKSLMPEGLEKDVSRQELADIIQFVASRKAPPKQFPGNTPQVADVRDDASIRMLAMHARIYGPTLVFEPLHRNLGFWGSTDDRAEWALQPIRAGRYQVFLEYAVDEPNGGNRFELRIGDQVLSGVAVSTGSWDNYRTLRLGAVTLEARAYDAAFQAFGPLRGYLLDLRTIRLELDD